MDILRIQNDLKSLLDEVEKAKKFGYQHAEVVLTPEIRELIPSIQKGTFKKYVDLKFTAGPYRCLVETMPKECVGLERAWHEFKFSVQGLHVDPQIQSIIGKIEEIKNKELDSSLKTESAPNKNLNRKNPRWLRQIARFFRLG